MRGLSGMRRQRSSVMYHKLAQAIFVQALKEARAKKEPARSKARTWLTCRPNRIRELILEVTTNLHQDDVDRFVRELEDADDSA